MPQPQSSPEPVALSTRERILSVAEGRLHDHGYLGLSLEEVAVAVGIRKASLYHHFPDGKQQLCAEIAGRILKRDERALSAVIANASGAEAQLEAVTIWLFERPHRNERMLRDAMRFMDEAHQVSISSGFMQQFFSHIQMVFTSGAARGELQVSDPKFAAWAFLGMMAELTDLPASARGSPDQALELFLGGVRPR